MEREPTTRSGLLRVRSRLGTAGRGARLLRSKREVLASEFFSLMREVLEGRAKLDDALLAATKALTLARALEGEGALESLAAAGKREVPVDVDARRVWGVPVYRIEAPRLRRDAEARGASPTTFGPAAADAARRHEDVLDVLLGIASRELHLSRLGEEIQDTSRRINALEQVLVPRLDAEASRIALGLEERAREESVRVKRFRTARDRRAKQRR
ncbi:MAG TPA: V-type ATP synthase subunit D [Anaeromyxobacteraceae bacterium]|nr:V-type ATP synthase subunit D [Anaeromyxobacteraceae bacterium]